MTIFFQPDEVLAHDPPGFGRWLLGHYLEHKLFITQALTLTPAVQIPDYDILRFDDDPGLTWSWLNAHSLIHTALRAPVGVTGIDLSEVDFSNAEQFDLWQEVHRTEHATLRPLYGITP